MLKQARKKDKEHFARLVKEKEREGEEKLQQEAAEYEDCLRNQLDRIDTLIQDKVLNLKLGRAWLYLIYDKHCRLILRKAVRY